MIRDNIFVKGAREHNLKNIDVEIPRDKIVVITGLSGSGKSSLAFDTIYAEGQRRYVESLSSYARQFLGQVEKPDVDYIEGLSPAISIDQKTTSRNPRSTVGTVTEIYDHLRLMFARIGTPHCYNCGREISRQSVDQMVDKIMDMKEGTRIQLLAPVVRGRKGEYHKLIEDAKKGGFVRVRIDGVVTDVNEEIKLDKNKKHSIEVVVDRLVIKQDIQKRLTDSIETVLRLSSGTLIVDEIDGVEHMFSQNFACDDCGISFEELTPRMFSFNNPFGACPTCTGLGNLLKIDPDLVIPDTSKSLNEGAIAINGWKIGNEESISRMYFDALAKHYKFSMDTPIKELKSDVLDKILYGTKGEKMKMSYERDYGSGTYFSQFEGVINVSERRYRETQSDYAKQYYESFMSNNPCPECKGARLKKESLAVTVGGRNIDEISHMSVKDVKHYFDNIKLTKRENLIADQILKEIHARVGFLVDVGLDYLSRSRGAG
ncbi:MAG: excinuclease ABC subunit UvrA, partial [Clostridia bacterium]